MPTVDALTGGPPIYTAQLFTMNVVEGLEPEECFLCGNDIPDGESFILVHNGEPEGPAGEDDLGRAIIGEDASNVCLVCAEMIAKLVPAA